MFCPSVLGCLALAAELGSGSVSLPASGRSTGRGAVHVGPGKPGIAQRPEGLARAWGWVMGSQAPSVGGNGQGSGEAFEFGMRPRPRHLLGSFLVAGSQPTSLARLPRFLSCPAISSVAMTVR